MTKLLSLKKYLLIIGGIICITLFSIIYYYNNDFNSEIVSSEESISLNVTKETISTTGFVDIKGAVKNPGVYPYKDGDKVIDAITLAGGLNKDAVTNNINLSKKLTNEMVIYIFTKSELTTKKSTTLSTTKTTTTKNNIVNKDITTPKTSACICETITVNNCITNPSEETQEEDKRININTADKDTLMTLNGIGESKASDIIEYRTTKGLFTKTEDIMNVSGISTTIYEKIKDNIRV